MATGKLTKRTIDAIMPEERDLIVWDPDLRGFGLKVTPRGAKSYILQYRMGGRGHPTRRYTIGAHGSPWTPDNARRRAQDLLLSVRNGVDPAAAEQEQRLANVELAFDSYVESFIEGYAKREQLRSWPQARQCLRRHAIPEFRSRPLPSITRRDVSRLVERVAKEKPATGRYLHALLRKLFRWSVSRGDLPSSPMAEMQSPAPVSSRDRVLSDQELLSVWHGTQQLGFPFGPIFRLLVATMQRREEVGGMRWMEVDLDRALWTIPASRAKNGLAHNVPLNDLALAELRPLADLKGEGLVFSTTGSTAPSGWSKAKARLDSSLSSEPGEFAPWRTHDLRRTGATGLQRLGVRFEVVEAVLNHVSGARSGVAGVYQRHTWDVEKHQALALWGRRLTAMIGPSYLPGERVVNIRRLA